jgi:hypothetical protein
LKTIPYIYQVNVDSEMPPARCRSGGGPFLRLTPYRRSPSHLNRYVGATSRIAFAAPQARRQIRHFALRRYARRRQHLRGQERDVAAAALDPHEIAGAEIGDPTPRRREP